MSMMLGGLLGGGDGGGDTTTSTSTSRIELSPEQKRIFNLAIPKVENTLTNFQPYQNPSVVPRNETQTQADTMALDFANGALQQLLGKTTAGLNFGLTDAINPATNPALQGVLDTSRNRINQNFTENTLPAINMAAIANGQYGGSRQGVAQGVAAKGVAQAQADAESTILNNAYNQGLDTLMKSLKQQKTFL